MNGWLDMVNGLIPDEWESLALSRLPARITNLEIEALFTTFLRQDSVILNISQGVAEACSHPTSYPRNVVSVGCANFSPRRHVPSSR
jgi:hypothetical protein